MVIILINKYKPKKNKMKDLNLKLKEYNKFKKLNAKNIYLWYDLENNTYYVSCFFSINTILNNFKMKLELIK